MLVKKIDDYQIFVGDIVIAIKYLLFLLILMCVGFFMVFYYKPATMIYKIDVDGVVYETTAFDIEDSFIYFDANDQIHGYDMRNINVTVTRGEK